MKDNRNLILFYTVIFITILFFSTRANNQMMDSLDVSDDMQYGQKLMIENEIRVQNKKYSEDGIKIHNLMPDMDLVNVNNKLLSAEIERIFNGDDRSDPVRIPLPSPQDSSSSIVNHSFRERVKNIGSKSIVALVHKKNLYKQSDNSWKLNSLSYGEYHNLCRNVENAEAAKYWNEPSAAFCTGFLINSNTVLTAGHCLIKKKNGGNGHPPDEFYVIIGYERINGVPRLKYKKTEVIEVDALSVVNRFRSGKDYAILRLKDAVGDYKPLQITHTKKIDNNQKVYTLGYPGGLPITYAGLASIRRNSAQDYFKTDLDSFAGNSGSPVINAETHIVEGILIEGFKDFKPYKDVFPTANDNDCMVPIRCRVAKRRGCSGQKVLRSSVFFEDIKSSIKGVELETQTFMYSVNTAK